MTDSSTSSSPPSATPASSQSPAGKGRPQRISKRRENKPAYHGIARYFNNHAFPTTATSLSPPCPDLNLSRLPVQIHQSSLISPPTDGPGYGNFLGFQNAVGNEAFEQQIHHSHVPNASFPTSSLGSYTFPSFAPNSSLSLPSKPVSPVAGGPSQISGNGFQFAPQTGAADVFPSDSEDMSVPGSRMGSFDSLDSFNSMALSLGTQASSITDGYVCPVTDSSFDSPMDVINDLQLPGASCHFPNLRLLYTRRYHVETALTRRASHSHACICGHLTYLFLPMTNDFSSQGNIFKPGKSLILTLHILRPIWARHSSMTDFLLITII